MAETTITGLPNATTPLAGTERVPMDQAGATKDATTQDIANLAPATDLTFTAATRTLASSTGADVVLPVATTTDAGLESAADKTKLDGVAAGATVNSPDATLLARANHTGTQSAGTITGLATVATTGAYADLSGKPTLGTAAATASTDYAPAAQGVTNGNSHNHDGGDGAQIAYSSLSGLPTLPTGTNTGDQTLANTSNAPSHTVTLSGSGGSLQLVEGSNITLTTSGTGSAGVVTIDASVTGGGSAPAPGYQTFANSALVGPMNAGGALASNNAVAQLVVYHPIYIPATQTFTQILSRTGSGYAGTTDIYLGIYSHDSTLNRPSSKIYDSGLLQITASGSANYGPGTISQSLSPGFYWLAFLASAVGATPAFLGSPANNRGVGFPWYTEFSTAGVMVANLTQASQATLPATASPIQGAAIIRPIVFLGV